MRGLLSTLGYGLPLVATPCGMLEAMEGEKALTGALLFAYRCMFTVVGVKEG